MYIEEVCVDGFKSYAQRVTLPGFDKHFNAITGLNGSGKSNILDSICFVLGITNLTQVRAGSLQELVYKQGQAGVTKATVSIVFNNSDRASSPAGYEHCEKVTVTRQVVIGGRNKYFINGHVAQPSRVQDLFHSVQLNVNNPHFLIMQGRITKVLNMKPPEILSLLEEAAGTRMYESKKVGALRTMEKKQNKVDEIDQVLAEEIVPGLEKLRKEKAQYMEWATQNGSIERLRRYCVAYEFVRAEELANGTGNERQSIVKKLKDNESGAGEASEDLGRCKQEVARLEKERSAAESDHMKNLKAELDSLSKSLVKETSKWTHAKEQVETEMEALEGINRQVADAEKALSRQQASLSKASGELAEARAEAEAAEAEDDAAKKELVGLQAGIAVGGATGESLSEQLSAAESQIVESEGEAEAQRIKAGSLATQLKERKKELTAVAKDLKKNAAELDAANAAIAEAEANVAEISVDPDELSAAQDARDAAAAEVSRCQDEIANLRASLRDLDFKYSDPEQNFDRSKVHGVVATLVNVEEAAATSALEVAAGGKLYQVVVDTDRTAKSLLKNGKLKKRVTIIPLNKVTSNMPSKEVQSAAAAMGAKLGLQLVGYDEELRPAIEYAFGSAFVCKDIETAKRVAFSSETRCTAVTLEGDLFNPSGLLTGGSRKGGNSPLARLSKLHAKEAELKGLEAAFKAADAAFKSILGSVQELQERKSVLDFALHRKELLVQSASLSGAQRIEDAVKSMEADLEESKAAEKRATSLAAESRDTVKTLKQELADFTKSRGKRLAAAEKRVTAAAERLTTSRAAKQECEADVATVQAEVDAAVEEKDGLVSSQQSLETNMTSLNSTCKEFETKVAKAKAQYDEASAKLDALQAELAECNSGIKSTRKQIDRIQKALSDFAVERRRLENRLSRLDKESKEAQSVVKQMLKAHRWIASEREAFGVAGGEYDFTGQSPEEALDELAEAEDALKKLSRNVNKKVMGMFDKAEAEAQDLGEKRRIILNDKEKIEAVIGELDERKKQALEATWTKVNKDFGSIFSTLLPGASAKLDPPEGGDFMDGLEVRVSLGGMWKASLAELSGGQRSLLALSLILALLLFKPAPMYILDEVDAALDLSHTQNIGRMIKSHFPQSQFIIVSLKEGMFNNANVIYRTRLVDGVSQVIRTVPQGKSAPAPAAGDSRRGKKAIRDIDENQENSQRINV